MSYLMMHTTHPLIHSRQTDCPAPALVRADFIRERGSFRCRPSDSMSLMTGSFDMDVHFARNKQSYSKYVIGRVPSEAVMPVSGVIMTLKKAQ
ncbi:Uncharacterised protein [Actinobacillus pleuropneumoniae]|uniref:Uncharacterized protein n=1 Tax=Paenibacillus lautus TaxID=1401 RepID=A0A385TR33_PAELA|nr:hypothetical protein D5F53_20690 [Paenibacillus lautus]VTR54556.1 Uncharacterised protein [Actinobacillus pleuropneumoniae]